MTALEARSRLTELEAERALAGFTPLADVRAYLDDLEGEIETWRHAFVGAALTEIATLRGQLSGPQQG